MGKKSKRDRKTKSGRHEEEEEEYSMNPVTDGNGGDYYNQELPSNGSSGGVDRVVSQDDSQIDDFMEGVDNLDNKKTQTRLNALSSLINSLQSGVDLYDRANSNMASLMDSLNRLLTRRSSNKEVILAMKVISILSLVAGAENDAFADEFSQSLINLATKSNVEDVDVRVSAVRTLAFIDLVCCGGGRGYTTFGVIGDIALLQSEGTDACEELQIAAADAWCLLASHVDPQRVCDVSRDEDMFVELVTLLGSSNTETKIRAGQCLALLWEVADKLLPDVDATESAALLCDDDDKVREALEMLRQIGKESSKRVNKRERKERKSALKSVTDWVLEGEPLEGDVLRLLGGEVEVNSFGEARVVEYLREVLKGGVQSCLRVFPVTRDMLGVEYVSFEESAEGHMVNAAAAGGGLSCEAFDKRFVRSQMGKINKTHRRNQRADKELMHAECF